MPFLDSSFLVDYLHGERYAGQYIRSAGGSTFSVSPIVLAELYAGAERSESPRRTPDHVAEQLSWCVVVGFTDQHAREVGRIRAELADQGEKINVIDTFVAGVARSEDEPLVAADSHFEAVRGLDMIDPREE